MSTESGQTRFAWHFHPEPHGREYTEEQLQDPYEVEQLFDACQCIEADIFAAGWRLLFKTHGLEGLQRINAKSGWFSEDEAEKMLVHEALLAGYDARTDRIGEYDEESGKLVGR
ncbi:MAG: hypothetical protein QM765_40630 [Myxococcales bacterium]